ncbi:MAG: rhomboid family intramembrane serine protease [Planctomycetota bacterium]
MRRIGSLPQERDARRFAAYLVTRGIDSHAEEDADSWAIWGRDEKRIDEARGELEAFRANPNDPRYEGVEQKAESIRREAAQQRQEAQKNVIEMRGQWKVQTAQHGPLTATLIALSVLVTLIGGFGNALKVRGNSQKGVGGTINRQLAFVNPDEYRLGGASSLGSLLKGEFWRAITPIFIHLSPIHLAFNMIMFFQFGRLVESLRGTAWFALMVLVIAVISNVAQATAPDTLPGPLRGSPLFGGMSGVVYGLFGYAWLKSIFDPKPQLYLSQVTVMILMGWLLLCMTPAIGNVANVAHLVGLVVGGAFGYVPTLWNR